MVVDEKAIRTELVVGLRNADILSTSARGVTTTTQLFSGNGSTTVFTVTNGSTIKNVRAISISAVPKYFGTDYTVNYVTGAITFTVAPASGSSNISVQYDYGTTDKIYPGYPRDQVTISQYPRIHVVDLSSAISEVEIGGRTTMTNLNLSVIIYDDDTDDVLDLLKSVRTYLLNNKKNFYNFDFLTLKATGPMLPSPNRNDKIMQKNLDIMIPAQFEVVA